MKRIMVVLIVLSMASVSMADLVSLIVKPSDASDTYIASDSITLQVIADFDVGIISFDKISQDSWGVASSPALNAGFDDMSLHNNGVVGDVGVDLFWSVVGSVLITSPDVAAGQVLWSFVYHVPDVPAGTMIHFTCVEPMVASSDFSHYVTSIVPLVISVDIPEPMTMGLLGLGGLFLRRRSK